MGTEHSTLAGEPDHDIKAQTRAQWGNDPAGSVAAGDEELGTPESFRRVEEHRYREQPWMHETFKYERAAGRDVLEVGVGLGTDHLQFARAGANCTGIDLTPRCIELTKQRFEHEGYTSNLQVMDAENLDFPDGSFDVVYSFGVLHHTPNMEQAFKEIRRVLRPGGHFIGGLYNRDSAFIAQVLLYRFLRREYRHETWEQRKARIEYSTSDAQPMVRLLTGRELRRLLQEAGFWKVGLCRRHLGLGVYTDRVPSFVERAGGAMGGWYLVHDAEV